MIRNWLHYILCMACPSMSLSLVHCVALCPGPAAFGDMWHSLVVCPSLCLSSWDSLPIMSYWSYLGNVLSLPKDFLLLGPIANATTWRPAAFLPLHRDPQHFNLIHYIICYIEKIKQNFFTYISIASHNFFEELKRLFSIEKSFQMALHFL